MTQVRVQLQEEVDRLADAVDSLDRTLKDMPLVGAVRVPDLGANLKQTVGALVVVASALVQTVGQVEPR